MKITLDDSARAFAAKISQMIGQNIDGCYQCGKCTAGCPVAYSMEIPPHEIIRLVQTLRGGDRPKNAHKEFADVTVMPRSNWEPWGLFRKPCEGRVQDNLRRWKTGGLRRISEEQPFGDVIKSAPTRGIERDIAPHPSLKPQAFMRQIVRAALPLGEGIVLDPFMGGGSTIAAACAVGYCSIGIESDPEFYQMAVQAIPRLAVLVSNGNGNEPSSHSREDPIYQQSLFEP